MWIAEISGEDGGLLQSYLHVDDNEHDVCVGIDKAGSFSAPCRGWSSARLIAASGFRSSANKVRSPRVIECLQRL